MPACLSQITMRNFWEKPWPCDGKYPIDFTRIGFHPIKRALARFTGMLCLLHAALVTTSSCKLSLSYVLWQPHLLWGGEHKGSAGAAAASHAWLLQALLTKQVQKAVLVRKLTHVPGIYFLSGSFTVAIRVYPEAKHHNSEIIALFNSTIFLLELLHFIQH